MATTKWSHRPPDKRIRISQPTNLLRATTCYFHHILIIGTIYRNTVGGVGGGGGLEPGSSNRTDWARAQLMSVRLIWNVCLTFVIFFMLMTKDTTNKKSTSTIKYAIKCFFNTFTMSLMTSFYKETSQLSVINKNKSLCSGVLQSPR